MTEQWRELKETIIELRDSNGTLTQQEVCKFLANYMEILEKQMQQPCEDCISREAVKALIKRLSFKYYMECGEYIGEDSREVTLINALKFEECFEDLPSVTPERPKGKWINKQFINSIDGDIRDGWECSKCQSRFFRYDIPNTEDFIPKYCPNCGAEMNGGGEDENRKSL